MNEIFGKVLKNDIDYLKANQLSLFLKDERGKNLIHYACLNETTEVLQYLIDVGLNVNLRDFLGETALFDLARKAKYNFIVLLIKAGINLNSYNNLGEIALHLACKRGDLEVIKLLIETGSDITKRTNQFRLPLHYALSNDDEKIFEYLLKLTNLGYQIYDDKRNCLLHYAASYGSMKIAQKLINDQFDVNYLNDFYETPLFSAVRNQQIELVKYLLNQGAYIEIVNRRYESVLMVASQSNPSLEKILLNYLESPTYQKYLDDNILTFCILNRDFKQVQHLIFNKSPLIKDKYQKTALDYAKQYGLNSFVAILLMK
ncbi:MAG: ankyrin repeat domain-containing protein [Acholeplasmatales bacterium]|nr:ankyrin repeat domain-containing protein [Acholeplasmatales bacterium]